MQRPLGVVMLPMIFGTSLSFYLHAVRLRLRGYVVETVDTYNEQPFRRPFFGKIVGKHEQKNLNELAARFQDDLIIAKIGSAFERLQKRCVKVAVLGFGHGGIYALKYAQISGKPRGVIAWYPHLTFPPEVPKVPPVMEAINCPCLLFFGAQDDKIEPGTLKEAQRLSREHPRFTSCVFNSAGHAFADATVQGCFPNPLWRPSASRRSWKDALAALRSWAE